MNRLDKEARKAEKIASMDPEQLADYVRDQSLSEHTLELVLRRSIENQARIYRTLSFINERLNGYPI